MCLTLYALSLFETLEVQILPNNFLFATCAGQKAYLVHTHG